MAASAELIREGTDRSTRRPSWTGPMSDDAVRDLGRALDTGAVSTLGDVVQIIGSANTRHDSGHAPGRAGRRRYDFSDQAGQALGSVAMGRAAADRLRRRLDQADGQAAESLVEGAFEDSCRESKEKEAQRMVPFGVRLSSLPAGGSWIEPSMYLVSKTTCYFIIPDDNVSNDDYNP
jgi:hypothetical protein